MRQETILFFYGGSYEFFQEGCRKLINAFYNYLHACAVFYWLFIAIFVILAKMPQIEIDHFSTKAEFIMIF